MKKLFTLFIVLSFFSCSDGDFDTPQFEFTTIVNSCGEYILYVKNTTSTETLVMTLTDEELGTTVGTEEYPVSTTLQIVYRLFNDAIGSDYFCQAIPPATPTVLSQYDAESATVNITTVEIKKDTVITGYSYEISISDLVLVNESGELIFYESFPFGTFKISL